LTEREQQRARVLTEVVAGRWTVAEAAQVLGLSVRQVWRLKATYVQEGATALAHGNRGRPASGRIADGVRQRVVELVRGPYADCNDSHLVELLLEREGIDLSRMTLRRILGAAGLRAGRRHRAPRHRRRRDRMSQAGMLLQIDGSPHHWLGPDQPRCTLLGAVDDATGEPVAAVFRQQEDAHGYFLLLQQVLRVHGVPQALYHDRHSIFQRDAKAPMTLDEELAGRLAPTQFGRALEELGIGSIAARSPQAKGRIERLWGTLQGRLVQELRLAGITDLAAANAFLPGSWRATTPVSRCQPTTRARPIGPCRPRWTGTRG
jgi:transposase